MDFMGKSEKEGRKARDEIGKYGGVGNNERVGTGRVGKVRSIGLNDRVRKRRRNGI